MPNNSAQFSLTLINTPPPLSQQNPPCRTYDQGPLIEHKTFRMSGPVVVIGFKAMLSLTLVAITFVTILLSSGCRKKTAARNPDSQSKNELHENTKPLQAVDLVGYDGTNLRKSVDKITKDNDKHNKEIENVIEDQ